MSLSLISYLISFSLPSSYSVGNTSSVVIPQINTIKQEPCHAPLWEPYRPEKEVIDLTLDSDEGHF